MVTIFLRDIIDGRTFPEAGKCLFDFIAVNIGIQDKIVVNVEGVPALPTMFLNTSIGKCIEEFGKDSLKKISFAKISKVQAEHLQNYVKMYARS